MGAERSRWVGGRWFVARACLAGASPGSHFQPAPSHSPSFHGTLERGSILRTSGPQPPALWNTLACGSASVPSFICPRAFEPRYRRIAPAAYSQSIGPSAARLGWVRSDRASPPGRVLEHRGPAAGEGAETAISGPRPSHSQQPLSITRPSMALAHLAQSAAEPAERLGPFTRSGAGCTKKPDRLR